MNKLNTIVEPTITESGMTIEILNKNYTLVVAAIRNAVVNALEETNIFLLNRNKRVVTKEINEVISLLNVECGNKVSKINQEDGDDAQIDVIIDYYDTLLKPFKKALHQMKIKEAA